MRTLRSAVVGAALVALIASACGPGGGSPTPTTAGPTATASATPAGPTLASTLVFGGPPECPQRPFCLIGLREVYGLEFREFRPLDVGGPITVTALAEGEIQVGLMFSSDPTIAARDFVVLDDDRQLQRADNIVPVVKTQLVVSYPVIEQLLNAISERLTQDELIELNRQATEEQQDPADIAAAWLAEQGLLEGADPAAGRGAPTVNVGRTNFYEQDIMAELYGQILEANGFTVARQEATGPREIVFAALQGGAVDILAEYAATALEHVNNGAGEATPDAAETTALLRQRLAPLGLTVLNPARATDQNVIVVTRQTADQYGLAKISDLAKPAP